MEISTLDSKLENPDAKPDLAKLASIAQSAKADSAGAPAFMQPGTKVKNKGGRPRKDGTPAQPASAPKPKTPKTGSPTATGSETTSTAGSVASHAVPPVSPVPQIPSSKIAEPAVKLLSRVGQGIAGDPRAAMTAQELDDVSMALGFLMDKHLPTIMSQYGAEAMFCMALTNWGTRVYALRQLKAEETAAQAPPPSQAEHEAFVNAEPKPGSVSLDPTPEKKFRPPVVPIGATDFFSAASKTASEYRV